MCACLFAHFVLCVSMGFFEMTGWLSDSLKAVHSGLEIVTILDNLVRTSLWAYNNISDTDRRS